MDHPEPDAPRSDLKAAWHRLGCRSCRAERREQAQLQRLLAGLPQRPLDGARRSALVAAFRERHGRRSGAGLRVAGALDRLAGGRRGGWVAGVAAVLALAPACPPWSHSGEVGDVLACWLMVFAGGLAAAAAMRAVSRGALTRGALLSVAAIGALAGNAILLFRCSSCFVSSHVLVAHASAVLAALAVAACVRPRLRTD